ncbi:MAG TPA: GGDEF domain-containing protein [Candidatus Limnocylindria bacterium]
MLTPSWPNPTTSHRPTLPPAVRRRVRRAERRALRRAVLVGATVMAGLILADLATNLVVGTPGARTLAPWELAAAALTALVGLLARRSARSEPLAMSILLITFGTALLGLALMPSGRVLGVAQLAIILVGAGLFLPWSQRWHAAGVGGAVAMAVVFAIGPLANGLPGGDPMNVVVAVLMAAATSTVGHGLWQARLRSMLEQQFALRHLSRYAQRQEAHVTELNRELNRVARRDSLTGVGNRLALDEAIARMLDQGDRLRPVRFALILFDIDHFKAYNDEHGHLAGDAALGRLGEVLRRATRGDDLAFRYGGEEFLLLLPEVDLTGALAVGERVRLAAADDGTSGLPPFTVSGGVALCDPADGRDPEPLLRRADAALYLAKRAGRNRIAADELSVAMQRQEMASAG